MPAVLAVFADATIILFYLLYWAVALGLAWLWWVTFHPIFQGIANALSFTVNTHLGYKKTFHLGGWATTIDHTAQELFSNAALGCEIIVGKFWHALAYIAREWSYAISRASGATLDLGHWIVHDYVPGRIKADLGPLWNKSNKTAAVAALVAAGLAATKREQRSGAKHQAQANHVAKAETRHAQKDATHAKAVAETAATSDARNRAVITQAVDVAALPVPFGRTVHQIRRRLGKVEALTGATAMAIAMANVLGVPNWRCLTKGPLGRFSRALCGVPSNFLADLLGLLADFFILENICTVIPWLEDAAEAVGVPLIAGLTDITAGLCKGSIGAADPLQGPMPTVPAYYTGKLVLPA